MIKCIFKPFIMRMVLVQKELKVQENMSLYCEIRQFISYVRDHHGGIFRNVRFIYPILEKRLLILFCRHTFRLL